MKLTPLFHSDPIVSLRTDLSRSIVTYAANTRRIWSPIVDVDGAYLDVACRVGQVVWDGSARRHGHERREDVLVQAMLPDIGEGYDLASSINGDHHCGAVLEADPGASEL